MERPKNLSDRFKLFSSRLAISFFVLSTISLAQGLLTVWVAARSQYHIEKGQVANKLVTEMIDLAGNKQRLKVWLAQHLLTGDSSVQVKEDLNAKMLASLESIRLYLDRDLELSKGSLEEVRTILEQKERLKTLEINIASLRFELEKIRGDQVGGDSGQIWKTLIDVFDNLQGADLRRLIADAIQIQKIRASAAETAAQQSIEEFNSAIYILSILALMTGVALSFLMAQRLRRPIDALMQAALAVKQGRLDQRIQNIEASEFGVLAERFNEMAAEIERSRKSDLETKQQVERQVEERTQELQSALERLQRNEAERQMFLMNISHELRTPATAIIGEVEVTLREKEPTPQIYRETLDTVASIGRQLALRVEDLLVLSQSEAQSLRCSVRFQQFVRLRESLDEAVLLVDPRRARSIQVEVESLARESFLRVGFDRQRFTQLMVVLLENAVRYSPKGTKVLVHLRADEPTERLEIRVVNQVSHDENLNLQLLKNRHYRGDLARRVRPDGLGIGLSIADAIIKSHGGELVFEMTSDQTFVAKFDLELKGPQDEDLDR
jgi:two-component system OmpR family sensor kinase